MIEADVLLRGREPREPIMAHPPETDSDVTLQEWLRAAVDSDKGIKLDFKRSVNITGFDGCIILIVVVNNHIIITIISPI